jgi:hypothetical protein
MRMTRSGIFLSVLAVALGIIYVVYFTDWFRTRTMRVIPQIRPASRELIPSRARTGPATYPVSFSFDGDYQFTEVKVLPADAVAANSQAKPLWHLVANPRSAPTPSITYGIPLQGMKPATPRARAEPLEPDKDYVLLVKAVKAKGQIKFRTRAVVPAGGH